MLNFRGQRWRWLIKCKKVHINMDLSGKPEVQNDAGSTG